MRPLLGINSTGPDVVRLQQALIETGDYHGKPDGEFGPLTKAAVCSFQLRHELVVDGVAGPIVWAELFPNDARAEIERVKTIEAGVPDFALAVIAAASSQIGVRENGTNRGAAVEMYQKSCPGNNLGQPWCLFFVQWAVAHAARECSIPDPLKPDTGHCMTLWRAQEKRGNTKPISEARLGDIFIMDFGGGRGHTGFVATAANGILTTIEGNTNDAGSREGDGVYRKTRKYSLPFLGVIRVYA